MPLKRNSEEEKLQRKKNARINGLAKRRSITQIEEIKEKIKLGVAKNLPYEFIARDLSLPHATFYSYLKQIRTERSKHLSENENALLQDYLIKIEHIAQKLYEHYEKTKDPVYLINVASILNSSFDRMQLAGYIASKQENKTVNVFAVSQFLNQVVEEKKVIEVKQ